MRTAIASLGVLISAFLLGGDPQAPAPASRSTEAAAKAVEDEIRGTIEAFREAFDKGDSKAVAESFTPDGELVDSSGETVRGREAIAERFAESFESSPGAKLTIAPESIRPISADTAIEEGRATITPAGGGPAETTRYEVIHVKRDGRWLQARVRDFDEPVASPHEKLKPLEWLLGEWVDEAEDGVVHTSCAWSPDGNYLLREFRLRISGRASTSGSQRIGWDPASGRIKSWVFDASGTHGEQFWVEDEDGRWIIKSTHTLADGRISTATHILERTGKDSVRWTSHDRTVADGGLADSEEYLLVRRPPPPK